MRLNDYQALALSALMMLGAVEVATNFAFPFQLDSGKAYASEQQVGNVTTTYDAGPGVQTLGPFKLSQMNLTLQCDDGTTNVPNVDIWLRASCAACDDGGVGPGDVYVSFNASRDSYPFPLDRNSLQDRLRFINVDAGVSRCHPFQVLP